MSPNPAFSRDPALWRAEIAGKCECCGVPFPIGSWIRRDHRLRITVLDGHQSAVQR